MSKATSKKNEEGEYGVGVKKSITLFIQGHGETLTNEDGSLESMPFNKAKHVTMFNIPGGVSVLGIANINPSSMTITSKRGKNIPDIELKTPQVDLKLVDYIHKSYHALQTNRKNDKSIDVDKEGMKLNETNIPLIYANDNIPYFGDDTESISRKHTSPFTITTPLYNKIYILHPSDHEDCEDEAECSQGNCIHKRREFRVCPEYGVTIVNSSVPEDIPYTLSGLEIGKRLYANLNQKESRKKVGERRFSIHEYWTRKLNSTLTRKSNIVDEDIRKITSLTSNENIKRNLSDVKENILDSQSLQEQSYDSMTRTYDIDKPVSQMSWRETMYLPKVTLSDIIDIFVDGMGYDEVYIIDPTCNFCEFGENRVRSLFQLHTHNIKQKVRSRRINPSEFPIVTNYTPNRNSDDNALYRVRNSYNTARVKAMEKRHPTFGGKRKSKKGKTNKKRKTIKKMN
jgi:hypothetical protein